MSKDEIEQALCKCGGKCIQTCIDTSNHQHILVSTDRGEHFSIMSYGRVVETDLDHTTAVEHFARC